MVVSVLGSKTRTDNEKCQELLVPSMFSVPEIVPAH